MKGGRKKKTLRKTEAKKFTFTTTKRDDFYSGPKKKGGKLHQMWHEPNSKRGEGEGKGMEIQIQTTGLGGDDYLITGEAQEG